MVEATDSDSAVQIAEDYKLAETVAHSDLSLAEAGEKKITVGTGRDGKPLVKRAAKPKAKAADTVKKYYVIFHAPSHLECLGIFYATWNSLASEILPGGALCGSGCSLKGYYTLREANNQWKASGWESEAPFVDIP